nr:hypothetical protein [Tanacetum cinerariifolium]
MALLWMAPKSYDSHRDKLLRRVDAKTKHSRVAKQQSLECSPASISPHVMAADQVITSQDALFDLFQWYTLHGGRRSRKNLEDSLDPTTAMNKALALIAKAFKVNTIPTNNNQRSSLIPRNSQIAQPDMNTSQDIKMQMVDQNVRNQVRQNFVQNDGNEVGQNAVQNSTPIAGNGNGINGNPIRCYNCREEGHYASNCTVKENQEKDKIGSKPDKNGKHGEAEKSLKQLQLQLKEEEKPKKTKKE